MSQPSTTNSKLFAPAGCPTRGVAVLIALAIGLIVLATIRLCVGQHFGWPTGSLPQALWAVSLGDIWPRTPASLTLMDIRTLRLVLGVLVGAALATSGVALQALLRNPLAEPYILGLSSGAGVGVMAQMLVAYHLGRDVGGNHLGALLGAAATMVVVYGASRRRGVLDPLGLLLIGVVMGTVNGGLILLMNYIGGAAGLREDLARWMMGYLNESVSGSAAVVVVGAMTLFGWLLLWKLGRAMDVATFSDDEAASLGVNLRRLRAALFLVASALAGGAVVLAGPIAFVGLVCPHVGRLLLGPSHRPLLAASAMLGAMLIVLADTASATIDAWFGIGLLPIGVFTAIFGGPVFVWMLRPQLGGGVA